MPQQRLKRPVAPQRILESPLHVDWPGCRAGSVVVATGTAPRRPRRNPGLENGDLVVREFAFWRHRDVIGVPDHSEEPALGGLAWHDHRARVSPPDQRLAAVEPQPRFGDSVAVALLAPGGKERPHAGFEELLLEIHGRRRFGPGRPASSAACDDRDPHAHSKAQSTAAARPDSCRQAGLEHGAASRIDTA